MTIHTHINTHYRNTAYSENDVQYSSKSYPSSIHPFSFISLRSGRIGSGFSRSLRPSPQQHIPSLPQGLLPVGCARNTSKGRRSKATVPQLTPFQSDILWMSKLFPPYLRMNPDTLVEETHFGSIWSLPKAHR